MNSALIAIIIIAPIFFFIMSFITLEAARRLGSARGRRRKQTSGSILKVGIDNRRTSPNGPGKAEYVARIEFSYHVSGKEFRSQQWTARAPIDRSETEARRRLQRYPVGSVVRVFFDPNDPSDAILEGEPGVAGLLLIGAAALTVLGMLLVVLPGWLSSHSP
jgi:hypothetical protein